LVHQLRKITGIRKIGFAGTLDPFASGLLIMAIGRHYTRQIDRFHDFPKTYLGCMGLGLETDTLDSYGIVTKQLPYLGSESTLTGSLSSLFPSMEGIQEQMPPDFSAKKIQGKRAYELARNQQPVALNPKTITIYRLKLEAITMAGFPLLTFTVSCSAGTYVRSFARDIGYGLQSVGYLKDLVRTRVGTYSLKDAISLHHLNLETLQNALFHEIKEESYV